jgi:tRNA-specific 2-thiouridylase
VRISVRVEGDRVAAAGFEASGCGAAVAAASAAVELADGARVLEAARIGPSDVAGELGGLSPGKLHAADLAADALHVALGRAVAEQASAAPADRVLVAMSGGVDSAVAALLCARSGADVVTVTLELWRDADNDAERSCCSAGAVRAARSGRAPARAPALHARRARRVPRRASSTRTSPTTPPADAEPVHPLQRHVRLDAMLDLADRLGAAALATGPLRARRRRRPAAARARRGEGPDVHARRGSRRLARAAALPARRPAQADVRALAAEAGIAGRASPTRRTSASSPARAAPRSSPATAGCATAPGDIVDRRGRAARAPRGPPRHGRAAPRVGVRRPGAALRPADDRATRHRRAARGARDRPVVDGAAPAPRADAVVEGQAALPLAPVAAACRPRGRRAAEPFDGAAPGRPRLPRGTDASRRRTIRHDSAR